MKSRQQRRKRDPHMAANNKPANYPDPMTIASFKEYLESPEGEAYIRGILAEIKREQQSST